MMLRNANSSVLVTPTNPVTIGRMGRAYGVLGWIKIIDFTDKMGSVFSYNPWFIYLQDQWKLMYLDAWRFLGKSYIAKMQDVSDRDAAQLLIHHEIVVDVTQLPYLQDGEYYHNDIIGCTVITDRGIHLGYVVKIIETTANDVLVIKIGKKRKMGVMKEILIPFIPDAVIKAVNVNDHVITVDWDTNY